MWRKWPCYEATSRIFTSTNMISLRVDVELSCNHLEASCYRRTLSLASSANIVFSDGLRIWISSIAILGFQNITEAHGPLNLLSTTSGERVTCVQTPTARHATSSLFLLGQSFTVLIHYKSIPDNFVESPTALSRISGATGAHLDVFLVVMIPFFLVAPFSGWWWWWWCGGPRRQKRWCPWSYLTILFRAQQVPPNTLCSHAWMRLLGFVVCVSATAASQSIIVAAGFTTIAHVPIRHSYRILPQVLLWIVWRWVRTATREWW